MTTHEAMTHERAYELLPWLVNESLDDSERQQVSEHATSCVICRREVEELTALRASIHPLDATASVPEPDMRRINARIDADLERRNVVSSLLTTVREWLANPWRLVFIAQTAVLVIVVTIWILPAQDSPTFETLTVVEELPAGHYLRVVFDPTVEASAISALAAQNDLAIVSGPTERGVFTLQFATETSIDGRVRIADALLGDNRVLFVQAVEGNLP